jgi:hypothetical protein
VRDPTINRGCATAGAARQQLAGLIPPRQVRVALQRRCVCITQWQAVQCGMDNMNSPARLRGHPCILILHKLPACMHVVIMLPSILLHTISCCCSAAG